MFNGLTPEETERLYVLAEELFEAGQCVCKILRHGYESKHPTKPTTTNREELELELGDVCNIINFMEENNDLSAFAIGARSAYKAEQFKQYLHHQETENAG
jgi:hypothetical protein